MKRAISKDAQPMLGAFVRFPRAMAEVAKLSEFGCDKYHVPMGDMGYLDNDADFYREKIGKHILEEAITGPINHDDNGQLHAVAIAWNALARLERLMVDAEKMAAQYGGTPAPPAPVGQISTRYKGTARQHDVNNARIGPEDRRSHITPVGQSSPVRRVTKWGHGRRAADNDRWAARKVASKK